MKNKTVITTIGILLAFGNAQAVTVFTDTFNYTVANAFIDEGGWTTVINTSDAGDGIGADAGSGIMFGNPGNGESALEFNYVVSLSAGDVIMMDANVNRGNTYFYGMRISLWDGTNAGSRMEVAGGTQEGVGGTDNANYDLTTVSYTVTAGDIMAGRDQVIFRYSNDGSWGETNDVTFDVEPVPEPSGTALLGLAGIVLILRRRK